MDFSDAGFAWPLEYDHPLWHLLSAHFPWSGGVSYGDIVLPGLHPFFALESK